LSEHEIVPGIDIDDQIRDLYNVGKSCSEIANELQVKPNYISRRLTKLRKWGELTAPSKKLTSAAINAEIRVYVAAREELAEIIRLTGLSPEEARERVRYVKADNRARIRRAERS